MGRVFLACLSVCAKRVYIMVLIGLFGLSVQIRAECV